MEPEFTALQTALERCNDLLDRWATVARLEIEQPTPDVALLNRALHEIETALDQVKAAHTHAAKTAAHLPAREPLQESLATLQAKIASARAHSVTEWQARSADHASQLSHTDAAWDSPALQKLVAEYKTTLDQLTQRRAQVQHEQQELERLTRTQSERTETLARKRAALEAELKNLQAKRDLAEARQEVVTTAQEVAQVLTKLKARVPPTSPA